MKNNQKSFPATLDLLPKIMSWVRAHIDKTELDTLAEKQIELALEEAIVNIINHAESDKDFSISCNLQARRQIEFVLTDTGQPFNPLTHQSKTNLEITLQEREEGGLGLIFMKKYMDGIFYRREDEKNILTLIKNL